MDLRSLLFQFSEGGFFLITTYQLVDMIIPLISTKAAMARVAFKSHLWQLFSQLEMQPAMALHQKSSKWHQNARIIFR